MNNNNWLSAPEENQCQWMVYKKKNETEYCLPIMIEVLEYTKELHNMYFMFCSEDYYKFDYSNYDYLFLPVECPEKPTTNSK